MEMTHNSSPGPFSCHLTSSNIYQGDIQVLGLGCCRTFGVGINEHRFNPVRGPDKEIGPSVLTVHQCVYLTHLQEYW